MERLMSAIWLWIARSGFGTRDGWRISRRSIESKDRVRIRAKPGDQQMTLKLGKISKENLKYSIYFVIENVHNFEFIFVLLKVTWFSFSNYFWCRNFRNFANFLFHILINENYLFIINKNIMTLEKVSWIFSYIIYKNAFFFTFIN